MSLLLHLEGILSEFRFMFNSQNFALFQAFIYGFITQTGSGTLTQLYQARGSRTRYWSFPKFLSRGKWDADAVAAPLIKYLQARFPQWVYVYDQTHALKTGRSQWGLHFFRNFSYHSRGINQSKFHYGHEFGALGLLCATPTQRLLFPVWVKLIVPQTVRDKGDAVLKRICSKLARGLMIFDAAYARRRVFDMLLSLGHHILCRAKSNAVFYRIPNPSKHRKPGRPKKYGDRLNIRRLRYKTVSVLEKTHQVASAVVRTKMCPVDVRLVVIRKRPKPSKPYRYFLVFTTDLTLEIPQIIEYYHQRGQHRDRLPRRKTALRVQWVSSQVSKKHQSLRATEFHRSKFDETQLLNATSDAETETSKPSVNTLAFIGISPRNSHKAFESLIYRHKSGRNYFLRVPLKIQTHTILHPFFKKIPRCLSTRQLEYHNIVQTLVKLGKRLEKNAVVCTGDQEKMRFYPPNTLENDCKNLDTHTACQL